jgi:hypothetical protein
MKIAVLVWALTVHFNHSHGFGSFPTKAECDAAGQKLVAEQTALATIGQAFEKLMPGQKITFDCEPIEME